MVAHIHKGVGKYSFTMYSVNKELKIFSRFLQCNREDSLKEIGQMEVFYNFQGAGIYKILTLMSNEFSNSLKVFAKEDLMFLFICKLGSYKGTEVHMQLSLNIFYRF